ncbi:hypothetical protein [Vitreimonas flagellata]|uniref:hypothetical protein n=1 Tax=Vitreimonas flagellata TaxID=2560861 RepID=UPI001074E242|nr:hypothetical protein [Vitreimonas flagellata]
MSLSAANSSMIPLASTKAIEDTLGSATSTIRAKRWLSPANRYRLDTIMRVEADRQSGTIKRGHLAQYIAVSTLLHCTDGWSYLGRSLQALISGDSKSAIHLAYYAELRAAMSILACEGIGVMNTRHFIVDAANSVRELPNPKGTHNFVWDCISWWANDVRSGPYLANLVRPGGQSLETWLAPLGGSTIISAHAQHWFLQWGMDLMLMGDDQRARNEASYRPSGMTGRAEPLLKDALAFVIDLWSALETSHSAGFDEIDRYILRLSLEKAFLGRTGLNPRLHRKRFEAYIRPCVAQHAWSQASQDAWFDFLRRKTAREDSKLFHYSQLSPASTKHAELAVISRACLLLRIASTATQRVFERAGIAKADLEFWRDQVGVHRGFWGLSGPPTPLTDLWADIRDLIADLRLFGATKTTNHHQFTMAHSTALTSIGSCERVALWTMAG